MRAKYISIIAAFVIAFGNQQMQAQSMHFSQYYNAPLLLNPANTGLMPDYDFRVGANYRSQWATLPVPYKTTSAFLDLKIGGNRQVEHPNWLGIGGAIFSDKAGDGDLSLMQFQGSIAYHLHLNSKSLLSFGGLAGYVQRSVNYEKLTFDAQWDGYTFNDRFPNGEKVGIMKTNFTTIAVGFNLSVFPNDNVYIKLGGGVTNVNKPIESFYGKTNTVGMRPTGNLDVIFKAGPDFIITPSVYYTTQNSASELIIGSQGRVNLGGARDAKSSQIIFGVFDRINDAFIGVVGYQYGGLQVTANYDFTVSTLSPYNGSQGAMEFSVIWGGNYYKNQGAKKMYACPRF